jgi:hypothetical protein
MKVKAFTSQPRITGTPTHPLRTSAVASNEDVNYNKHLAFLFDYEKTSFSSKVVHNFLANYGRASLELSSEGCVELLSLFLL